jgi:hypothetical protein
MGWTSPAHAQGRRGYGPRAVVVVGGYGYYPYPYLYDPWYAEQWGMYPPYYRRYNVERESAVRLEVKPKDAEVYVDGFYAGIVDDFNDWYERLYTAPGGHQITLFLDGYRTHTQQAYLTPDHTFKVKFQMEKLAPGEVAERPPAPPPPPPPDEQEGPRPRGPYGRPGQPPTRNAPSDPSALPPSAERARGTLELRLQPADAEVLVDGQSWQRSGADRVTIDLSEGNHSVQVRKSGYVGYLTDVDIRPGETATLDVNLRTQPQR